MADAAVPTSDRWRVRALIVAWVGAIYVVAHARPPWGDEVHFLETVRIFGNGISTELLRTYSELAGPLTFGVYAAWGRLVGFETSHLRLLSTVLAALTLWLLDDWLRTADVRPRDRALALGVIALNPYFVGLSAFVFTDMLALFFLAAALRAVQGSRALVLGAATAGLLLTRQSTAFFVLGAAAAIAVERPSHWRRHLTALVAACAPLAALIWLWHGLTPLNERRDIYLSNGVAWDPAALSVFIGAAGVYLAPEILWVRWRDRAVSGFAVAAGLAAAVWTLVFPIRATTIQVAECCETVGYAHRAAVGAAHVLHAPPALAAALLFATGALLLAAALTEALRRRSRTMLLPLAAALAFLAIAPITHIRWEKYALPLVIVTALAVAPRHEKGAARP